LFKVTSKAGHALLDIYQPILRGYFAVVGVYYFVMSATHFWYFEGAALAVMAGVSILATYVAGKSFRDSMKRLTSHQMEKRLFFTNILMIANVVVALNLDFRPEKMTYFIMMVMIFALVGVSFRQSLLTIAFALVALLSFATSLSQEALLGYFFLVFAAAMASLSITYFLRSSIMRVANAKIDAEEQLEEAKIVSETLRERSLSDSLTSLPNRRAFFQKLRDAKAEVEAGQDLWLVLIDLDGFKAVNDIHGHLVGDVLLQAVSERLLKKTAGKAHVSRMGGDEFNLLFTGKWSEAEVEQWNNELLEILAEPYSIEGRAVRISGSIGCKQIDISSDMRSQINQADFALMTAKATGKNRGVLFNQEHAKKAAERFEIERALRSANLAEEIELVFQPQIDLSRDQIVRAEALARWSSPAVGTIQPGQFIQIAEESGLIGGITLAVVEKAFAELHQWENPVPISVNLSSHDLITDIIIDQIIKQAEDLNIDQDMVEFEVTETAMMTDFDKATNNLCRLADTGFSIALDDFGTGYSNFNYLRRLPIGKLKVDRSFMENPNDPMTEKVLFSLAGMARTLGVHCLLEGVENEVDLLMAKRVGADTVQGFLFGEPMTADALQEMVNSPPSSGRAATA
jgi:diguanylate cyclase (GGDEF)-like protein